MNNICLIISGFIIGVCAVLPGISGTVIAMLLGIYDEVLNILVNKKNVFKLIPLSAGLLLGIFLFGKIMYVIFNSFEIQIKYIFIGITFASINSLNNEIIKKENKNLNIKYLIISFFISLILFKVSNMINLNNSKSFFKLVIAGFLYVAGKIIPGVSSSIFMIILGLYEYVLLFLSNPITFIYKYNINLIPFFIGIIIGLVILIKLINYLLNKHFRNTYSFIIGLILSSLIFIFPGFKFNFLYIISLIFMFISFIITYYLTKN